VCTVSDRERDDAAGWEAGAESRGPGRSINRTKPNTWAPPHGQTLRQAGFRVTTQPEVCGPGRIDGVLRTHGNTECKTT